MKISIKEVIRQRIIKAYPEVTNIREKVDAVQSIRRINFKLQRLSEAECNGFRHMILYHGRYIEEYNLTAEDEERIDEQRERLLERLFNLCNKHGFYYRVQNDPRGSAIKLSFTDRASIDFIGTDTDLLCN